MREDEGFDILHNGMPHSFRDQKAMAYRSRALRQDGESGRPLEIVDRANGTKFVMLANGRTA
jgi:hypothetical protein